MPAEILRHKVTLEEAKIAFNKWEKEHPNVRIIHVQLLPVETSSTSYLTSIERYAVFVVYEERSSTS